MLERLHQVQELLPMLLRSPRVQWQTLQIHYHPPFVDRVWTQLEDVRVYLHRIHGCERGEALMHPHPWPSAIHVYYGSYEMDIGYGAGEKTPPTACRLVLGPGSEYEMMDRDGWHSVRPLGPGPSFSLMVSGERWDRWSPAPTFKLGPLKPIHQYEIMRFFESEHPVKP